MREAMNGSGKTYAKKKPGQYPKGGGKGLQGDALKGNVSQSTINDIKRMGMTAALRLAGENGKTAGGVAREFQEGVRRMYGANRLAAAKAKYAAPAAKSADAARSAASAKQTKSVAKSADAAKAAAVKRGVNASSRGGTAKQTMNAMKPTAQQMSQAKARAGGNPNLSMAKATPKATETPAQKAAKAALKQKQRAAAAAAVKRAGGRTM